jgi:HSP20 family protein
MITRSDKHETRGQRSEGRGASSGTGRGGTSTAVTRPELHAFSASPFALMRRMAEDMDRMFESFGFGRGRPGPRRWSDLPESFGGSELSVWVPEIEVVEREGEFLVRADLPGLKREDVRLEVAENALTIEGERRQEQEERKEGFYRTERSYGRFSRTVLLPEGVDTDNIKAQFRDGVLEVRVPAPERQRQQRRRFEIGSA